MTSVYVINLFVIVIPLLDFKNHTGYLGIIMYIVCIENDSGYEDCIVTFHKSTEVRKKHVITV